ncbi:MAG: ABC transporter ATP-binding protein [Candidatus Binatia bacterium]
MELLLSFARAYPRQSILMMICLLLATVAEGLGFSSVLPLLTLATLRSGDQPAALVQSTSGLGHFIEQVLGSVGLQPSILLLCLLIISGMALKAGFVFLAQRQIGYTVAHVATDLRLALLRSVLSARWRYYIRQPLGTIANAFTSEASRAAEAYLYATSIVALSVQTLLYLALAVVISWQATLGTVAVGVMLISVFSRLVRRTRRAGSRQTHVLRALVGQLMDVLYAVKPFKAMAREGFVTPLLEGHTHRLNRAFQQEIVSKETLRAVHDPLVMIVLTCGLYLALTRWALSLDVIVAMSLLFERTLSSLNKIQRQYQSLASCESAYWSLQTTISDSASEREHGQTGVTPRCTHGITFRDVCLSYEAHPVLTRASLFIPAGQITALVGTSGGGKTSIVDMVVGLVEPQSGDLLIDDVPFCDIDSRAWRWSIGYVPQEVFLLHDSVLHNITMGDPTITETEVEAALRAAHAWEFVAALPTGLHTSMGERGARFSGGQRQRIAIARALVHRPRLLILDEATAALDTTSELAICESVRQLRGAMTILFISHRPALLAVADVVYSVEQGQVYQQRQPGQSNQTVLNNGTARLVREHRGYPGGKAKG